MIIKSKICQCLQHYTRNSIIRTGKVPLIKLFAAMGVFDGVVLDTNFLNNIKVRVNMEDWVQQLIYFFGVYEFEKNETFLWIELSKRSDVILDIGSNIGYYSLISCAYKLDAKVYSFEPAPSAFNRLKENFQLNGFSTERIFNKGLSNDSGLMKLYISDIENSGMSSLSIPESFSGEVIEVEVDTIDGFVKSNNISTVNLVKIDVEGNELNVLKGMEKTLINDSPILFIEILDKHLKRFNHSANDLYDYLHKMNYSCYEMNKFHKLALIKETKDVGLAICFKPQSKKLFNEFSSL